MEIQTLRSKTPVPPKKFCALDLFAARDNPSTHRRRQDRPGWAATSMLLRRYAWTRLSTVHTLCQRVQEFRSVLCTSTKKLILLAVKRTEPKYLQWGWLGPRS